MYKFNPFTGRLDEVRSLTSLDARYLKLDGSNDPITGQLDVNNILTSTDFRGYGGVPATLGAGLKSPHTRTVVVDQGGKGDYTTIKGACDYVATQTRGLTAQWLIQVMPGNYTESPFTIPSYTKVKGSFRPSYGAQVEYNTIVQFTAKNGNWITCGGTAAAIEGMFNYGTIVPDGDLNVIRVTTGTMSIESCAFTSNITSVTYNVRGVYQTGGSTYITESSFSLAGDGTNKKCVETTGGSGVLIFTSIFVPPSVNPGIGLQNTNSAAAIVMSHCRIGFSTTDGGFTTDLVTTGVGSIRVNNTPYNKYSGSIVHIDRMKNNLSGLSEAVLATDVPQTIKGATSQSANLTEWQNSSGTVLAGVDERGVLFSDAGTGVTNLFIGDNAGRAAASGATNNVGLGANSLQALTSGDNNIAVGRLALSSVTTGTSNFAMGTNAGANMTSCTYNFALGDSSLYRITDGLNNIAIGISAGTNIGSGSDNNVFIGRATGTGDINTDINENVMIGSFSGTAITTGSGNIFLGFRSGSRQTTSGNLLLVDNRQRADIATELTNSILYGVMAATPASQTLRINAVTTVADDLYVGIADNDKAFFGAGADMSLYYDGTSGYIKTSEVAASDLHITTGTEKTVVLDTPVWEDIQFSISSGRVSAANFPDWDTFTTNTSEYKFDVNDFIDLACNELSHSWQEGSTVKPHLHITLDGANSSGGNQYAKFTVYIGYSDVNEVWTETDLTAEYTIPTGTADMTHLLLSMGDLAFTNQKIGTQVKCRIKRIAATGGTEYPNHMFVTQLGFHVLNDTLGSRTVAAK